MSTSIELHVEVKIKGIWMHYNHPSRVWDTQLYALMAGVGNHPAKCLFKLKGCPPDMSAVTFIHLAADNPDAHHITWLSSKEVVHLAERYRELFKRSLEDEIGYFFGSIYAAYTKDKQSHKILKKSGLGDFRFIYWFCG